MRTIGVILGEGFKSTINEYEDGRVLFVADADIDADGANGQNGGKPAYMVWNKGSEHLANGGMGMRGSKVVFTQAWGRTIAIWDSTGQPVEFPGQIIASKTSYHYRGMNLNDPKAYVDSDTVSYAVVPPVIIRRTLGAVMGCRVRATNMKNGKVSEGIIADAGPTNKIGEVSIQMARELGVPSSPRSGGTNDPIIKYEIWPGVKSSVNPVPLLRSNGQYVD